MLNGRAKIKLMSAGICLIAAGTSAPAVSFAQQNDPGTAVQTAWAAPLDSLKDAQGIYAREMGMVSAMPEGSLAPRAKAAAALQQIKLDLLRVINSDKIPRDLAEDLLNAIQQAETALTTDGAQTIAYSLETVRQEVAAIQARLAGQQAPQAIETAANGQPLPGDKGPDQQAGAANASARQMAEAQNRPQPQPVPNQAREIVAKAQDQQMRAAQANQPSPTVPREAKERGEQPSQQPAANSSAANQPAAPAANQPAAPQTAIADLKHGAVIGSYLRDKAGNDVAQI